MDIVKRCRWLLLLAASSTAVAGEVRIEFASSYVAKPQPDGNIEVLVTVTAKLPLVHGGIASSGPLGAALDQAAEQALGVRFRFPVHVVAAHLVHALGG